MGLTNWNHSLLVEADNLAIRCHQIQFPAGRGHAVKDGGAAEFDLVEFVAIAGGDDLKQGALLAFKGGGLVFRLADEVLVELRFPPYLDPVFVREFSRL